MAWAQSRKKTSPPAQEVFLKPEKRSITIATTNLSALPYLPLLVAQQKGFFTQHGLELIVSEQQSAARANVAVASGSADLVCGWLENAFAESGRSLGLQCITLLGIAPMMALGVSTRQDLASISQLTQLRGRKIGVVALSSPTHTVALAALRRAGMRGSEVGFVSVGSAQSATAALRSGQIDALLHMDPLMLQLEQREEIKIVADMRSPSASFGVLGMHLPSSCIAAPAEFSQRYPGTTQACSDALVQALQWLARASLRDMLQMLPDQTTSPEAATSASPMDAQLFVASFARLRNAYCADGVCTMPLADQLLQVMVEAEPTLRLAQIDVQRSINNAYAERSAKRLKR